MLFPEPGFKTATIESITNFLQKISSSYDLKTCVQYDFKDGKGFRTVSLEDEDNSHSPKNQDFLKDKKLSEIQITRYLTSDNFDSQNLEKDLTNNIISDENFPVALFFYAQFGNDRYKINFLSESKETFKSDAESISRIYLDFRQYQKSDKTKSAQDLAETERNSGEAPHLAIKSFSTLNLAQPLPKPLALS